MRLIKIILSGMLLTLASATVYAQKGKDKNAPVKDFKENFSSYRPSFSEEPISKEKDKKNEYVVPKNHINEFLQEKIDSIYSYNEKIQFADGYRILLYNGTKSDEARLMRNSVVELMPSEKVYTDYKQPNFKVKIGDCVDKLEAYYLYAKLIKFFPNAIVVPDKVNIIRPTK